MADLGQLVKEDSACLDTFPRLPLDATHSAMNKFDGPNSANFLLVKNVIRQFADDASVVVAQRERQGTEQRE